MDNERKEFVIFSQRLAGYLMQNRFVLLNMRPDENGSGKNVFIFNDSPALQSAISAYNRRK